MTLPRFYASIGFFFQYPLNLGHQAVGYAPRSADGGDAVPFEHLEIKVLFRETVEQLHLHQLMHQDVAIVLLTGKVHLYCTTLIADCRDRRRYIEIDHIADGDPA